jgi:hypothetical protein
MENLAILQPGTPASADATDCGGAQPRNEHPVFPWHGHFSFVFFCQGKGANRRKTCKDAKRRRYTGGFGAPIFCIHMNYTWIPIFVLNHPIQQQ